jgi:hypothetical protein
VLEQHARTETLRRTLATISDHRLASDLLFLEAWLIKPAHGPAMALRVGQLRRANPQLVADINHELTALRRLQYNQREPQRS